MSPGRVDAVEFVGEQPAEAQAPLADALVADRDHGRQDQFDVTQAEVEE